MSGHSNRWVDLVAKNAFWTARCAGLLLILATFAAGGVPAEPRASASAVTVAAPAPSAEARQVTEQVEALLRASEERDRLFDLKRKQLEFEVDLVDQATRRGLRYQDVSTAHARVTSIDRDDDWIALDVIGPADLGSHSVPAGDSEPVLFKGLSGIAHYPDELLPDSLVTLYAITKIWSKRYVVRGQPPVVTNTWHLIGIRATVNLPDLDSP